MTTLALIALAGISACARISEPDKSDDDGWTPLGGDNVPISFSTNINEPATKTSDPLATIHDNFRVFGFYQRGVVDDDPAVDYTGTWNDLATEHWTPNFMYNQPVEWFNNGTPADDSDDYWRYGPVKYWPNNAENTITFWAYSPYYDSGLVLREADGSSDDPYGSTVPGLPDIQFTSDGTRDLLISDLAQDLSHRGGDPSTVSLTFHHAMCWVDFTVTKVDPEGKYDMYLQSIEIVDIYGTAVYSQRYDRWLSPSGSTGSLTFFPEQVGDPDEELSNTVAKEFPPKDGGGVPVRQVMPVPQRLSSSADNTPRIRVVYAFKLKTDEGVPATAPAAEFPLGRIPGHTRWDKEAHYTYNIRISPGLPLLFTASVTPWATEENGYFNVYE